MLRRIILKQALGSRPARVLATLALAGIFALGARADVIHQPGGGKIVGEIVAEKPDYIEIKTRAGGILRVPRDEIDRIERGPVAPAPPPPRLPAEPKPIGPAAPPPVSGEQAHGAGEAQVPAPTPAPPLGVSPLKPGPGRLSPPGSAGEMVFGVDEEALVRPREKAVLSWFQSHGGKLKAAIPQLLKDRRKAAFDFIMDPNKYPDANHGAAAQPDVDRLVAALRRVWEDPFAEALELSPELSRLAEEMDEVSDGEAVRARVNKALAPASEPPPQREAESLEWNAKGKSDADPEERACVEATNRYRMMFGLRALRMDDRLLRAARKHSKSMVDLGFFDHTSPVKGLETPERRVAAEGASYSAENIALGCKEGVATFDQWYTSSGHHRNILGDHTSIGVGRHETHWTQNFGRDVPK